MTAQQPSSDQLFDAFMSPLYHTDRELYWTQLLGGSGEQTIEQDKSSYYPFVANDSLSFCPVVSETFEQKFERASAITDRFSDISGIIEPALSKLLTEAQDTEIRTIVERIVTKYKKGPLSEREQEFLSVNRGTLYSITADELQVSTVKGLRVIHQDQVLDEIPTIVSPLSCLSCDELHLPGQSALACYNRNLNGPLIAASPPPHDEWVAVVMGTVSFMSLPWLTYPLLLNLGFVGVEEYSLKSTVPLRDEHKADSTPLGQSILNKIKLFGLSNTPILIEYAYTRRPTQMSVSLHFWTFCKVIKAVQRLYLAPLVVVIELARPLRHSTLGQYRECKRLHALHVNTLRVVAGIMAIPLIELVVQGRPCLPQGLDCYIEANPNWAQIPLFNRIGIPSQELNSRICGQLLKVAHAFINVPIPKDMGKGGT